MADQFHSNTPALANQIANDIPDIKEVLEYFKDVFERILTSWSDTDASALTVDLDRIDTISAFAKTILDDADEATFKATVNLEIGTDVQAYHAILAALAGVTGAADKLPYFTGATGMDVADVTAFARTMLDDADASTALSTLGVSTFIKTLLDDADAATARATLGVDSFAQLATGTYTGDGSTDQGISGIGFAPEFVWVAYDAAAASDSASYIWFTDMGDNKCIKLASGNIVADAIISGDADGFTVDDGGSDEHPNKNSATYNYICIG